MQAVVYLVLRRLRKPLVVLVIAYAISVLGFVMIPGLTPDGEPYRMSFFHAFYFVSFMGSTIGFGEIPHEFTDTQRFWTLGAMYVCVVAWFYAIGSLIALLQDPIVSRTITRNSVIRQVRRLKQPFYLVCGYGDTGSLVIKTLAKRGIHCVTVDNDEERVERIQLDYIELFVPRICGNATDSQTLIDAGLKHRRCMGLLALTNNDQTNLHIAITSKLLNPRLPVISRAEHRDAALNMLSFHTDHVVHAYDAYNDLLDQSIDKPDLLILQRWLTGVSTTPVAPAEQPPQGKWIVCGYGRYGRAIGLSLKEHGSESIVIEVNPNQVDDPLGVIYASGTEAVTLKQAGIGHAVGIVAGTDNDANNLSIILTAKELNPDLYTVIRQNHTTNAALFEAVGADIVTAHSRIVASEVLSVISTSLTREFLRKIKTEDAESVKALRQRIADCIGDDSRHPTSWGITIDPKSHVALNDERCMAQLTIGDLQRHHRNRHLPIGCVCLLLIRDRERTITPDSGVSLQLGDQLLFCGSNASRRSMNWVLHNPQALDYCVSGQQISRGWFWRKLAPAPKPAQPENK